MRIGPFYIDTKEVFLIIALIVLLLARFLNWPIYWFDIDKLLVLTGILLITKALMHTIAHERFFLLALVMLFLTLYMPITNIIIIYGLLFFALRLIKFI